MKLKDMAKITKFEEDKNETGVNAFNYAEFAINNYTDKINQT